MVLFSIAFLVLLLRIAPTSQAIRFGGKGDEILVIFPTTHGQFVDALEEN